MAEATPKSSAKRGARGKAGGAARAAGAPSAGAADVGVLLLRLGLAGLLLSRAWSEATSGEETWVAIGASIDFIGFHPKAHLEAGAVSVFVRLGAGALLGAGLTTRVAAALLVVVASVDAVVGLRSGGGVHAAEAPLTLALALTALVFTGGGALSFDRKPVGQR
jgi:uncharacterized membrane protein YphA (DoxX/SURF4 family)